jgi:lipoprotein-anchoring transpeptidase ErfK/SrfK
MKLKYLLVILFIGMVFMIPSKKAYAENSLCEENYIVSRGDTLSKIASSCNTTVKALLLANPQVTNKNLIFVDQKLTIPELEKVRIDQSQPTTGKIPSTQIISPTPALPPFDYIEDELPWIDIVLSEQRVYAYLGSELVNEFTVSTGKSTTPTVTGQYRVWIKLRYADMRGPGYHLKNVPYVMYFYKGYGLHGTYWHNNFGTPMSHGCVNLKTEDAEWVYNFVSVGSLINVRP